MSLFIKLCIGHESGRIRDDLLHRGRLPGSVVRDREGRKPGEVWKGGGGGGRGGESTNFGGGDVQRVVGGGKGQSRVGMGGQATSTAAEGKERDGRVDSVLHRFGGMFQIMNNLMFSHFKYVKV